MQFSAKFIKHLGPLESNLELWLHRFARPLYARKVNLDWLDVSTVPLRLPRLGRSFHGYRLLQISDIHMGTWMTPQRLADIVALLMRQSVDLIAITGDFVGHNAEPWAADLVQLLSRLEAPDGVVAVLGNHDHWTNPALIRQVIADSGILDLSNQVHSLPRDGDFLYIAGIDDYWEGHARIDAVLQALPPQGCAILLAHEPDFAKLSAASGRFDLQISGHSHGGQFILPGLGPLIRIPHARKYPLGLYQVGDMLQYTNRGLGTGVLPFRINCPPEITIFEFSAP